MSVVGRTGDIDECPVEELAGHMNPIMARRYAHLYPSAKRLAITLVFG